MRQPCDPHLPPWSPLLPHSLFAGARDLDAQQPHSHSAVLQTLTSSSLALADTRPEAPAWNRSRLFTSSQHLPSPGVETASQAWVPTRKGLELADRAREAAEGSLELGTDEATCSGAGWVGSGGRSPKLSGAAPWGGTLRSKAAPDWAGLGLQTPPHLGLAQAPG